MTQAVTVPRGWNYAATIPWQTPRSLDDLHGPLTGIIMVPPRINTSPRPSYDLDDPRRLHAFYNDVVRDGMPHEQEAWLDKTTLLELWPYLMLPVECRVVWESRFPELADTGRVGKG